VLQHNDNDKDLQTMCKLFFIQLEDWGRQLFSRVGKEVTLIQSEKNGAKKKVLALVPEKHLLTHAFFCCIQNAYGLVICLFFPSCAYCQVVL